MDLSASPVLYPSSDVINFLKIPNLSLLIRKKFRGLTTTISLGVTIPKIQPKT